MSVLSQRFQKSSLLNPEATDCFSYFRHEKNSPLFLNFRKHVESTTVNPASSRGAQHNSSSHSLSLLSQLFHVLEIGKQTQETQNQPTTVSFVNAAVDDPSLAFPIYHNFESRRKFLTSRHSHPKIFIPFEYHRLTVLQTQLIPLTIILFLFLMCSCHSLASSYPFKLALRSLW